MFGIFSKKAPSQPKRVNRLIRQKPDPVATHHYLLIVLDSCRYDSFVAAEPTNILRLGQTQRRYSYASWTSPSHFNLLTGLVPHQSPAHVFASEYYKEEFLNFNRRFGIEGMEFAKLVPGLWLPEYMQFELGYQTHARVSLPVLNPKTGHNRNFDSFRLMDSHNDMAAMLDTLVFDTQRPSFHLLNVGETHYPFVTPHEDPKDWPRISGVHGVFKHLDSHLVGGKLTNDKDAPAFFDQDKLDKLKAMQVNTVRYLDKEVFPKLFDLVPENTFITVTADHGELFGEGGYFGHGPIMHEKVFEVPFIEGLRP